MGKGPYITSLSSLFVFLNVICGREREGNAGTEKGVAAGSSNHPSLRLLLVRAE